MSLKKNIAYSGILTVSLYFLQFITFPYVARVLGVNNLGVYNYCNSYVAIFTLTSFLGITTIGVREIAKVSADKSLLDKKFSAIFALNVLLTLLSIILYVIIWFSSEKLRQYDHLMTAGLIVLISNVFLVEWLFRGVEDFKYVTYRTLILRVIYCLAVFIFVRHQDDLDIYFYLSVILVVVNAIINWKYKNRYVHFSHISYSEVKQLISPTLLIGGYLFFASYNSNFFPVFLGERFDTIQVGLFVTASKLILIFLLLFNAYTLALIPRLSSYVAEGNEDQSKTIVLKSYRLLLLFLSPVIFIILIYANEIIFLIAGQGYESSATLMRLCIPILILNGINQINISQVLLPASADRFILQIHFYSVLLGVFANYALSFYMSAESSVFSWMLIETLICILSSRKVCMMVQDNVFKIIDIRIFVYLLPLLLLLAMRHILLTQTFSFIIGTIIILLWTHVVYRYMLKDDIYNQLYNTLVKRLIK